MADVFISYSRKDKDFVRRLHDALAAHNRDTWVDWEDIPATADWWREVAGGIEAADAFVFVISPDSARSDVCRREIDHALANGKRMVPLLVRPITDPEDQQKLHSSISSHNWIFFRETDDFDAAVQTLITALDTDLSHVRTHTRLLVRAHEWENNGHNRSFLLQGDDLKGAESWLAQGMAKKPAPTPLHVEYLTASRLAETARQRTLLAGVSVALVVSLALAALALGLFGESNRQRGIAEENAATATVALGDAEIQAELARNNAATAISAQNEAQLQATAVSSARDRAQSIALAGQAQVELDGPRTERAPLLALYAFTNFGYTWQAERALALSVAGRLERRTLKGHGGEVTGVDWSPDSLRLLTASNDFTARIWDLTGKQLLVLGGHQGAVTRALWSPDGKRAATASLDGRARIFDAQTGELLLTLTGHTNGVNNLAWSPDSRRLATAGRDGTARVWDAQTGTELFQLSGHTEAVNSVVWGGGSAYGTPTRLVTASDDDTARLWDGETGALKAILSGHGRDVVRALFSPDGKQIATASEDNTARLWDGETGALLYTLGGHTRAVTRAVFSPDGSRLATASDDTTVRIWDTASGELLRTLFGHTGEVNSLAWSPGGSRLLTVSEDRSVRVWFSESGGQLLEFPGHTNLVWNVAWSPDGQYAATASADGTARIWQVWRTAQSLITFTRRCCTERILTDEENIQFGLPTATVVPAPSPVPACDGALPARMYVGARGRVTEGDSTAVNVRNGPGTGSTRISQVVPGQTFQVISGPECREEMAWFEILYGISAIKGWIAEGQNGVYFVEPAPGY